MSKKPAGLGRGLDELLSDNSPSTRSKTVVIRAEQPSEKIFTNSDLYGTGTKPLYDTPHKNKSVKANFKK